MPPISYSYLYYSAFTLESFYYLIIIIISYLNSKAIEICEKKYLRNSLGSNAWRHGRLPHCAPLITIYYYCFYFFPLLNFPFTDECFCHFIISHLNSLAIEICDINCLVMEVPGIEPGPAGWVASSLTTLPLRVNYEKNLWNQHIHPGYYTEEHMNVLVVQLLN